jgi:hypothetical protein
MRQALTLIAVAFAAVVIPSGAHADGGATTWPRAAPIFALKDRVVFDPVGEVGQRWRLWAVVADYDRRFAPLDLVIDDCADHPDAGCVKVREVRPRRGAYWGRWTYHGDFRGVIELNPGYRRSRHVTCHEVGHALGLTHHTKAPGCLRTSSDARHASRAELRALRTSYAGYCRQTYLC